MPSNLHAQGDDHDWRRYVAFSFSASDLLVEIDQSGLIRFATGATEEMLGLSADAVTGKKFLSFVADPDRASLAEALDTVVPGRRMQHRTIGFALGHSLVHLSGFKLPHEPDRCYLTASRVMIPSTHRPGTVRDAETGLLSSEDFTQLVEDQIRLIRDTGHDAAITLLQLNGLDSLQRRISPQDKDSLLREVGATLQSYSLGGDAAGRLDDDKYGVVYAPGQVLTGLMNRVRDLINQADPTGDTQLVEQTISLSDHKLEHREAAQAIRYAVNRFVDSDARPFDIDTLENGVEQHMQETVERIGALRRLIDDAAFDLAYQPIVDLADRDVHHYEALTRFPGGDSPFDTITFAEQIGIIEDFDLAVVRKVQAALSAPDAMQSAVQIAVNLSARSLESDTFVSALRALLATDSAIRPRMLFEITESYKAKDLKRVNDIMQVLRGDGHCICLDDFGAGGASFDYIQNIEVDFVKLDGAYVRQMMDRQRDLFILKAMADLCANLKIETIAEFVETESQAKTLRQINVQHGQGYLFGKPDGIPKSADSGLTMPAASAAPRRVARRTGERTSWA